jgi:hypothetical protein
MSRILRSTGFAVAAIVLIAAALRVYRIDAESLWTDEVATLQQSAARPAARFAPPMDVVQSPGVDTTSVAGALPWTRFVPSMRSDTHPPLYPMLMRLWRTIFGGCDAAARALPAVCSLASILLLFDICRMLHGRCTACWAAAIMAVATPQIVFAHEARSYAALVLLVLASIDVLVRIETIGPSTRRGIVLAALTLAAMLTHYLAIPIATAVAVYALMRLRGASRTLVGTALLLAVVIFVVACGPSLWAQRDNFRTNLEWISDDAPGVAARTFKRLATLPLRLFITPRTSDAGGPLAMLGAALYFAPLLLVRRRDLLLWILLGGAVVGAAAVSDLVAHRRTLAEMRFTLAAAPAAYALLAAAAQSLPRRWLAHATCTTVLACCVASLPEAYNRFWKPDFRGFAASFDQHAGPHDLVISAYTSANDWYEPLLVAATTHYSSHPNRPMLALSRPASSTLLESLTNTTAWFLSGDPHIKVEACLPGARVIQVGGVPQVGVFLRLQFDAKPSASAAPTSAPAP